MVGSAVDTMVWSSAARACRANSAPRITQSRRLSDFYRPEGGAADADAHFTHLFHDVLKGLNVPDRPGSLGRTPPRDPGLPAAAPVVRRRGPWPSALSVTGDT